MSLDNILPASAQYVDSPFTDVNGYQVQYAWDSVSLTSILSCPRRYQYTIAEGQIPNSTSYAIALVFGILVHKGIEYYHLAKARGDDHDAAVHMAVRQLSDHPMTATLPIDDDVEEMKEDQADDDDGITLRNSKVRTRYYLFRAVVWYLEHYAEDKMQTYIQANGLPAVELSFRVALPISLSNSHPVLLCGHLDRVVTFNDNLFNVDYKTAKSLSRQNFEMFDLSHQMTGYNLAGGIIFDQPMKGTWIDGIALQIGQAKFARHLTKRTVGQMNEYLHLVSFATELATKCATEQYYPMNTASCYFCEYKAICRQPPEFRDRYLAQHFTKKPGWNPLENRS